MEQKKQKVRDPCCSDCISFILAHRGILGRGVTLTSTKSAKQIYEKEGADYGFEGGTDEDV